MALTPGTRLGPYLIVAQLGAGGMGEVYRARDPRLDREVALKVLPEAFARDAERLARFEREGKTVAGLNHPNIVTLFSIEEVDGVRFLTMELVEGKSLDKLVAPGGLPLERVLELAVPLAEAMVAAHARGIVHRDLKPANVMVSAEGRVKVLDFGLAKPPQALGAGDATQALTMELPLSGTGLVLGSVPYMAPEQVRGEPVDARTDVFAFGAMLYELLTGQRPFKGATFADVSSSILRDAPLAVSSARAGLPLDIDRIVGRCLEKSPRDRYQSASDAHSELRMLQRMLEGGASGASKDARPDAPSIAVLPFSNMSADPENEYFSDGLTEELLNVLAKNPGLKVTGRTSSFAFKGKHEDLREIGHKLGVGTLLEGSVRRAGNRVRITAQLIKVADGFHLWSETYDRVLDDIFAVQDDIASSVATAMHVTLLGKSAAVATKTDGKTYELLLQANNFVNQSTGPALARAVVLYQQVLEVNPNEARAWAGLASAYVTQCFYGHGPTQETHALGRKAAERALALDDSLSEAHEVLGWILASLEFRWQESLDAFRRASALAPGAARPIGSLGVYLAVFGQAEQGLELLKKAEEIDPLNPHTHINRARVEGMRGNPQGAVDAYLRARDLSPSMSPIQSSLGLAYLRLGQAEQAVAEIQKDTSPGYRDYALAIAYHVMGRPADSDAAVARMHTLEEQWAFQFAAAHAMRNETDEAFRWLDRALELHDSGIVLSRSSAYLVPLHADPRWPVFLAKLNLPGSGPGSPAAPSA